MEQLQPIAELVGKLAPWPCLVLAMYIALKIVEKTGFRFKAAPPTNGQQTVDIAKALAPAFAQMDRIHEAMVKIAERQVMAAEQHNESLNELKDALRDSEKVHQRVLTSVQILIDRTGRSAAAG